MIRPVFAAMAVAAACMPALAQTTPLQRCKAIADSLERLRCYDALEAEPAPASPAAKPAAPARSGQAEKLAPPSSASQPTSPAAADEPLIDRAKAAVISELRDPDGARFADLKVRTVAGKQAVCGTVNAKNARGRMAGPQPFAYDGERAYLVIYNPGPANISNVEVGSLISAMRGRVRSYSRLCR